MARVQGSRRGGEDSLAGLILPECRYPEAPFLSLICISGLRELRSGAEKLQTIIKVDVCRIGKAIDVD